MYSTKEMRVLRLYGPVYDVPAIPITKTMGKSYSRYKTDSNNFRAKYTRASI